MLNALAATLELAQVPVRTGPANNTVAIVGLVVAAVVGVAGPIIAALFARSRLSTELSAAEKRQQDALNAEQSRQDARFVAERERLDRQLASERERLARQLAHDRGLADLADLRALLDEAVVALHRADYARAEIRLRVTMHGRKIKESRPDAVPALNAAGQRLDAIAARLSIRLGRDDAAASAFGGATGQLLVISNALAWLEDETPQSWQEKRKQVEAASEAFEADVRAFKQSAIRLAGSRAGEPPDPTTAAAS